MCTATQSGFSRGERLLAIDWQDCGWCPVIDVRRRRANEFQMDRISEIMTKTPHGRVAQNRRLRPERGPLSPRVSTKRQISAKFIRYSFARTRLSALL